MGFHWLRYVAALCMLVVSTQGVKPSYGAPYKGPPVVPVILPGGFLADTREVAAAKEYHMNALAKQAQAVKGVAQSPRLYDKPLWSPDPQNVYQAKAYTQAAYRSQSRPAPVYEEAGQYSYEDDYQNYGPTVRPDPMVTPRILDNGFLAETPEVDAAKAEHFAAVAKAQELVAQAQAKAAQSKGAGLTGGDHTGYSGGGADRYSPRGPPSYSSGPSYSQGRGYQGGGGEGYAKFNLEYRSSPGYSRSDTPAPSYSRSEAAPVYSSDRLSSDYAAGEGGSYSQGYKSSAAASPSSYSDSPDY